MQRSQQFVSASPIAHDSKVLKQFVSTVIVDSKNNTDADGTHRNSKIYKVPMPGKLCHAGSTREALELYFSGNTNELHETFDHIADSAVRTMTNETWKAAVQEADLFLLELYAPWCGHCKTLEPQYDAAAVSIREAGYDRTSKLHTAD
jgi:thiol-disulfide isomerase/thioredoxin